MTIFRFNGVIMRKDEEFFETVPALTGLILDNADSKEEVYFSWWLDELQAAGFIRAWGYQSYSFNLSDRVQYQVKKPLKTKVRVDDKLLLHPHTYTPDFFIDWDESARGLFYNNLGDMVDIKSCAIIAQDNFSRIDVKPKQWGNNSFMEAFRLNQKWTFDRHGVYVQPVVVVGQKTSLFETTFTPRRYFTTDKSGRPRKLNYKARTLAEFVEGKRK
jgi:hypothetical protein